MIKKKIQGHVLMSLFIEKLSGLYIYIDDNGEVLSCVVHHMVLKFITYKSMEEKFIIAIDHSQATTKLADKDRELSIHFSNVLTLEDGTSILTLDFWGDEDSISFDLTKILELIRLRYLKITSNVSLKLPAHDTGSTIFGDPENRWIFIRHH
uniref:Uncharacterized protein n=1 Tax=Leersia perrieri TaxID=77586 RepID=A0A0D9XVF4_9ORYZ